jgi:hypothetical protein
MAKNSLWRRAEDYSKDETRDPLKHSHSYHRHFQGYAEQRVANESGKGHHIERVYVEDYYRYAEDDKVWRLKKLLYVILVLAAAALILFADTRPAQVNLIRAVGLAQLLSLLPAVWLVYQLILHLTAPRRLTIGERDQVDSFKAATLVCVICTLAISAAMPIALYITDQIPTVADWTAIILRLTSGCLLLLLWILERKRRFDRIPNQAITPTGANEIW